MPDIIKCRGAGCKLRKNCHRYNVEIGKFQEWYINSPIKEDGTCDHYVELVESIEGKFYA